MPSAGCQCTHHLGGCRTYRFSFEVLHPEKEIKTFMGHLALGQREAKNICVDNVDKVTAFATGDYVLKSFAQYHAELKKDGYGKTGQLSMV